MNLISGLIVLNYLPDLLCLPVSSLTSWSWDPWHYPDVQMSNRCSRTLEGTYAKERDHPVILANRVGRERFCRKHAPEETGVSVIYCCTADYPKLCDLKKTQPFYHISWSCVAGTGAGFSWAIHLLHVTLTGSFCEFHGVASLSCLCLRRNAGRRGSAVSITLTMKRSSTGHLQQGSWGTQGSPRPWHSHRFS